MLTKASRWLTVLLFAISAVVMFGGPAVAHQDLVSTNPMDGATETKPIKKVSLTFSVPGKTTGDGIRVLD